MAFNTFIQGFLKRNGAHVFSAVILSKVFSLLLSVIVIRILTKQDYGNLMYAYTVVSFVMPFMGMGIFQSFVKYAPIQKFMYQRKDIFRYTFIGGCVASLVLICLLILFSPIITLNMPDAYGYLLLFSFLIFSLFIFESVKSYFRILYLNKPYAKLEIIHAVLVFVLGSVLTYLIGGYGFILALILVPLFLSIYILIRKRILSGKSQKLDISKKHFWMYGIYTSLGGLVAQLIFSVDLISIANLMDDAKWVAQYKAVSLIPFSLLFLPGAVIKTDFVKLVQEAKNRVFLLSYIKNFMMIFSGLSVFLIILSYLFGDWFILTLFGDDYQNQSALLQIFIFGIAGAFVFRVPFGNIMVAIGWTKINTLISVFTLLADIVLNYFWIQKWGIMGAAYATSLLLWFSGLAIFLTFLVYLNRLKKIA